MFGSPDFQRVAESGRRKQPYVSPDCGDRSLKIEPSAKVQERKTIDSSRSRPSMVTEEMIE